MGFQDLSTTAERQLGLVTTSQARQPRPSALPTVVAKGVLVTSGCTGGRFACHAMTWRHAVVRRSSSPGPTRGRRDASRGVVGALPGSLDRRRRPSTSPPGGLTAAPPGFDRTRCGVVLEPRTGEVDLVPVTSVGRTVCDLVDGLSPSHGWRGSSTMRAGCASWSPSTTCGRRTARCGVGGGRSERSGGSWPPGATRRRRRQRAGGQLRRWLREAGLPDPEQQHRIDAYRIDLAYPSFGLLVEYDGFDAHTGRLGLRRRPSTAERAVLHDGLLVLRFTSASTREEVVGDVAMALAKRAAA